MSKEQPPMVDGIRLPDPVSPDEYPDESFANDYNMYTDFQRDFGPQDDDLLSLAEYAAHCRAVTIPLRQFISQWEQEKYGGRVNWDQNTWNMVHSNAENTLRARYKG